jgi:hypothetical protein
LGSEALSNLKEDEETESIRNSVMEVVRSAFRPEFLNRLDEILLFSKLKRCLLIKNKLAAKPPKPISKREKNEFRRIKLFYIYSFSREIILVSKNINLLRSWTHGQIRLDVIVRLL